MFGNNRDGYGKSNGNSDSSSSILSSLLECMIVNDFDFNVNDKRNGETIIFDLIREKIC